MNRGFFAPLACALALVVIAGFSADAHAETAQTGWAGGSQPFPINQPYLGINYMIRIQGGPGEVGEVKGFAGDAAPGSYALAHGQILSIAQNTALYNVLGTTYGGNGTTTFALPDLRGRTPVHVGQGAGLSSWAPAQQRGSSIQTLTVANLPAHTHSLTDHPEPFTAAAGTGAPFSLWQPSLGMNHAIAIQGNLPSAGGTGPFLGRVKMFAGTTALPSAYVQTNGQLLPTSSFSNLESILADTYGGNGSTTFALPDLKSRAPMGAGAGPGLTARTMGEMLGEESAALSLFQMATHSHGLPYDPPLDPPTTGSAGGGSGATFDVLQPSLGLRYIIATQGDFPTNTETIPTENPMLGEIALFAGAGNTAPAGWTFAEGQPLTISENLALASILGGVFGGDATTFRLPDLRGRLAIGAGQGLGLAGVNRGEAGGRETVTLVPNNLAAHTHEFEAIPEPGGATLALLAMGCSLARRRR